MVKISLHSCSICFGKICNYFTSHFTLLQLQLEDVLVVMILSNDHDPLSSTLQAAEQRGRAEQVKQAEEAEGRLGVQLAALGENVVTLKREWQGGQRRAVELEKQTDELRGEIAVLEATVQNNQDERRALLERSGVRC